MGGDFFLVERVLYVLFYLNFNFRVIGKESEV